jgi:putative glutamine amidotransferase
LHQFELAGANALTQLDRRPLIGIPSGSYDSSHPGVKTFRFNGNYTSAVAAAGGLPIAIPLDLPEDTLIDLYTRLDGLLLAGGGDIDPAHYGEEPHPALGGVDQARDHVDLILARWALQDGKPLLGICRGIQTLNVAAGGTLYQDVPTQYAGAVRHSYDLSESPWERPTHSVRLTANSFLANCLAATELSTNSFHHQAVRQVAPGFNVIGCAEDGLIEAIEDPAAPRFTVGVQWHPEAMTRVDMASRRLFATFVEAAGTI